MPQDAHGRLVLQVYLGSNTLEFSAINVRRWTYEDVLEFFSCCYGLSADSPTVSVVERPAGVYRWQRGESS